MMLNKTGRARTKHEIFEAWIKTKDNVDWSTFWHNQLVEAIELYRKYDLKLICLLHESKKPVANVGWTKRTLEYDNALTLLRENMNLGVNLKASNLIVAEIDSCIVPSGLKFCLNKTVSVMTKSSHYHIYFNYDTMTDKETLDKLTERLNIDKSYLATEEKGLFRGGPHKAEYTVLPYSAVDKHYYEFINTSQLMNFSELLGIMETD